VLRRRRAGRLYPEVLSFQYDSSQVALVNSWNHV